jgi:hypothetical protein
MACSQLAVEMVQGFQRQIFRHHPLKTQRAQDTANGYIMLTGGIIAVIIYFFVS